MTLREVQALLLLFESCPDERVRERAVGLVPDLAEWRTVQRPSAAKRWLLTASTDGHVLGAKPVVCREEDLAAHEAALAAEYDLASHVKVSHRELP